MDRRPNYGSTPTDENHGHEENPELRTAPRSSGHAVCGQSSDAAAPVQRWFPVWHGISVSKVRQRCGKVTDPLTWGGGASPRSQVYRERESLMTPRQRRCSCDQGRRS